VESTARIGSLPLGAVVRARDEKWGEIAVLERNLMGFRVLGAWRWALKGRPPRGG
jgi:hypothetical protein